ncbi:MAG: hypothetical protein H8E21_01045 [Gammaproteobacteria bacterium]|nr:hypothetical protein [Gammaproteobacteria bacterium]MBL6999819.1 hypothetical protein [Gammaproteobacteria bacterium]
MNNNLDLTIKLDAKGKVDINYYMDRAYKLRAETIANMSCQLKSWLKSHFNRHIARLFIARKPLHH